jgi:endonuclease/exonuclease/phosphatase family metal-dependent hydrolase
MRAASLVAAFNSVVLALMVAFTPRPDTTPRASLRLMTLNAQFFMSAGNRVASSLDGLSDLIDVEHPDIVALQETDANSPIGANLNGPWWISRANGMNYYYGPPTSKYTPGVALLSRWPITSARHVMLPAEHSMARGVIDAVVAAPGGPVQVIVAHLQWAEQPDEEGTGNRKDQIAQTAAILRMVRSDMPSVILGDFNAGPGFPGPAYEMLQTAFDDGWMAAGNRGNDARGYTWPSADPEMRIDLVWLSSGDWAVTPGAARVLGDVTLSDHRAVIVDATPVR